jgi:hypothetical protein
MKIAGRPAPQRAEQFDHLTCRTGIQSESAPPTCVSPGHERSVHAYKVGGSSLKIDIAGEPAAGIENHSERVGAGYQPRRELRIVRRYRTGADDDDVAQRSHAMQVQDVLVARDELRLTSRHGDEPVQALAQVADRDRSRRRCAADRQIQIEQRAGCVLGRQARSPSHAGLPGDRRGRVPDRHSAQQSRLGVGAGVHRKRDKVAGFLETFGAAGCSQRETPGAICASLVGGAGWLHDVYGL